EEYIKDKKLHEYILFESLKYDSKNIVETDESLREKNHLQRTDPLYSFFEDVFSILKSERIPVKLLFQIYKSWHFNEMGAETHIKQNAFTRDAKPHAKTYGYEYDRKNMRASMGDEMEEDKKVYSQFISTESEHFNSLLSPQRKQDEYLKN